MSSPDKAENERESSAPVPVALAGVGASEPVVTVSNLAKHFRRTTGERVPAVDGVSFEVAAGELLVLLGPSGCGKTTLLRCIAGLESPDSGRIVIRDKTQYSSDDRIDLPPQRRPLSMVFQSYALWPHMTAFDNVAFPLRSVKTSRAQVLERVMEVLTMAGIQDLARQYPSQMSGGQAQRVALARAIVTGDPLILFDEPLSNVDAKVREELRFELLEMQRKLGFAAIYVTHDQTEAMELATRVAVMRAGKFEQVGTGQSVYNVPKTRYVANFIGTANEFPGRVMERASDGSLMIECELGKVVSMSFDEEFVGGDEVFVIWRPEKMRLSQDATSTVNTWVGELETSMFAGAHVHGIVKVDEHQLRIRLHEDALIQSGEQLQVSIMPEHVRVLTADQDRSG